MPEENRIVEVTTENCMDELALDLLHSGEGLSSKAYSLIHDAIHIAASTAIRSYKATIMKEKENDEER